MSVLVRTLLIWLLALAIPVQGAAAASMAFCGPGHHGGAAAAKPAMATSFEHVHLGVGAAVAHEHTHIDAGLPTANDAGLDAASGAAPADAHSCSVCGSCCSSGVLASIAPGLPVAAAAATVFSPVVASVGPFAAGGLDRPPRNLLA